MMFDAKNCPFLPQETQFTAFLSQMSRESQHMHFEDQILGQVSLWGRPASCASLIQPHYKTVDFHLASLKMGAPANSNIHSAPCSGWPVGQTSPEVCIQLPPWGNLDENLNHLYRQNSLHNVWIYSWLTSDSEVDDNSFEKRILP